MVSVSRNSDIGPLKNVINILLSFNPSNSNDFQTITDSHNNTINQRKHILFCSISKPRIFASMVNK